MVNVVQLDFYGMIFKTFVLVHRVFVFIVAIASRHLLDSWYLNFDRRKLFDVACVFFLDRTWLLTVEIWLNLSLLKSSGRYLSLLSYSFALLRMSINRLDGFEPSRLLDLWAEFCRWRGIFRCNLPLNIMSNLQWFGFACLKTSKLFFANLNSLRHRQKLRLGHLNPVWHFSHLIHKLGYLRVSLGFGYHGLKFIVLRI